MKFSMLLLNMPHLLYPSSLTQKRGEKEESMAGSGFSEAMWKTFVLASSLLQERRERRRSRSRNGVRTGMISGFILS